MALKNTQYDTIIREYNKKQLHHRHIQDLHLKEVYDKLPEIQDIDKSISSLSVKCARKLLDGDDNALNLLKTEIKQLSLKRKNLLETSGYPADYLELHYDCPDCKDTGYIDNQKCHCFKKASIHLLYSQSNIEEVLKRENFEHFSYAFYSDSKVNKTTGLTPLETAKNAVLEAKEFVASFDTEFRNLFFYGDTGVGKTFLSNCIAKELIDSSHSVIYFSAFQLFDLFAKNTFDKDGDTESSHAQVFDCDLLIIDDLGTELTNSFVSSQLFLCINERLLRKKSTIISTNLTLDTIIDTYSERTFSRISSNYKMIKLIGEDIRIKKRLQKRN